MQLSKIGIVVLLAVALALAACGGGDDDEPASSAGADEQAAQEAEQAQAEEPAEEEAAEEQAEQADEAVAQTIAGQEVEAFYVGNCSACHGQAREGLIGPPLQAAALIENDAFYFDVISMGRVGTVMPAWSDAGMTDPEIRAMIAWLRAQAD